MVLYQKKVEGDQVKPKSEPSWLSTFRLRLLISELSRVISKESKEEKELHRKNSFFLNKIMQSAEEQEKKKSAATTTPIQQDG